MVGTSGLTQIDRQDWIMRGFGLGQQVMAKFNYFLILWVIILG